MNDNIKQNSYSFSVAAHRLVTEWPFPQITSTAGDYLSTYQTFIKDLEKAIHEEKHPANHGALTCARYGLVLVDRKYQSFLVEGEWRKCYSLTKKWRDLYRYISLQTLSCLPFTVCGACVSNISLCYISEYQLHHHITTPNAYDFSQEYPIIEHERFI